jgi:ribosomal protein L6P/L9E
MISFMYTPPQGVQVAVEQNVITVSGISKQQVGQAAAEIRCLQKSLNHTRAKELNIADERIITQER